MPLWQLTPVDPADANWLASSYCGKALVRARDETQAREIAESAFGVKTRFVPGRGVSAPPWKRPELVAAEIVEDPRHDSNGPAEVLLPSLD